MTRARVVLLVLAAGCADPPVDDFRREGGGSPDPTGVVEGDLLYVGPRPVCRPDGTPIGRVVLTLFAFDDPPPPEGTARSALNLMTVPGRELFSAGDCLPEDATPEERAMPITRSAPFTWPEIALGEGGPVSYQIRGFYDGDGDFIPFFAATNLPTGGDIVGGAFTDPVSVPPRFRRIELGAAAERPDGDLVSNVTVTLGGVVWTERPLFRLGDGTHPLSSEATVPVSPDPLMAEDALFALADMRLTLYDRADARARTALDAAGVDVALDDPLGYAWYVRPVDLDADGMADPHPVLGGSGFPWMTPVPLLVRARTPIEVRARIPDVLMVASVRPSRTAVKRVFYPSVEVLTAPIALVTLNPAEPVLCRVPYVTPGNLTPFYERQTAECHEVPTGFYGVSVLHGVAGGRPAMADMMVSDTGLDLEGGAASGQAWTIPNELGDPLQIAPDAVLEEQGLRGLFLVHDPMPDDAVGRADGRAGCDQAIDPGDPAMGIPPMMRAIRYRDYSDAPEGTLELCCGPVRHLCGLPLCPAAPLEGGATIRSAPTTVDAAGVPECVPFRVPAFCCG